MGSGHITKFDVEPFFRQEAGLSNGQQPLPSESKSCLGRAHEGTAASQKSCNMYELLESDGMVSRSVQVLVFRKKTLLGNTQTAPEPRLSYPPSHSDRSRAPSNSTSQTTILPHQHVVGPPRTSIVLRV